MKFQMKRPAPEVPDRVVYYALGEVVKDFDQHSGGWIKLKSDDAVLIVGKYDQSSATVCKTVTIDSKLSVTVRFGGNCY